MLRLQWWSRRLRRLSLCWLVSLAVLAAATAALLTYAPSPCAARALLRRLRLAGRGDQEETIPALLDTDRSSLAELVRLAGVNCSDLERGDRETIARAEAFVRRHECAFAFDDAALSRLTCAGLRQRGYAMAPGDADQAAYPIAFALRLHRSASQAELLLRTIYAPQNVYCVHVDSKASPVMHAAMRRIAACLPNVRLIEPEVFVYGSASPVAVDLRCMRAMLDEPTRWRYFVNLAGEELPLKGNGELVRILRLYNGSNDAESGLDAKSRYRYERRFWCVDRTGRQYRCWWGEQKLGPPPGGVALYKGSSYGFFSREFVEWVLAAGGRSNQAISAASSATAADLPGALYRWLNDTYSPDEHYWASLNRLPEAPGGYAGSERTATNSRAVIWYGDSGMSHECRGKYVRDVCVYGSGDLPWLLGRHEAFANKFYYEYDPIVVHCLTEHVRGRSSAATADRTVGGGSAVRQEEEYLSVYRRLPQIRDRQQQRQVRS